MHHYFDKYYKPIIFSTISFLGLIYLEKLRFSNLNYFITASVIYIVVLFLLLLLDQKNSSKNSIIPLLFDKYSFISNVSQHFILPIWLVISIIFVMYVNIDKNLVFIYTFLGNLCLLFCFVNIHSFYANNFLIERRTHLIYDFIKIFLFVINSNILLHFYFSKNISEILLYLSFASLTFFLIFLICFRRLYEIKRASISILLGTILMLLLMFWCISVLKLGFVYTNIFSIILFYIISAFIHHELDETLTVSVITEYLLWVLIMISILWGLN